MRRRMHACHMRRRIHTWMITPNTGRDVNAIPTRDMAFTVGITTIFTDALSSGSTAALATSPADEQMEGYNKCISLYIYIYIYIYIYNKHISFPKRP
jgi:hypothetical protein